MQEQGVVDRDPLSCWLIPGLCYVYSRLILTDGAASRADLAGLADLTGGIRRIRLGGLAIQRAC